MSLLKMQLNNRSEISDYSLNLKLTKILRRQ